MYTYVYRHATVAQALKWASTDHLVLFMYKQVRLGSECDIRSAAY